MVGVANGTSLPVTVVQGRGIETAPLETVNYERLTKNDSLEIQKLFRVAQSPGFFYLDLQRGTPQDGYLTDLKGLYKLGESYYSQSKEVKMKDFRKDQDRGYKSDIDAETFEIAREEAFNTSSASFPASMRSHSGLIKDFISSSHTITMTMLSHLSDSMGLEGDARFEHRHRDGQSSDCALKMESAPMWDRLEDIPPSEHTDMGTLTLLFCDDYTTQLRIPGTEDTWAFINPKPGHAIVNVADSLQAMSDKKLLSCLHRVSQPVPGAKNRFCVLYYLRPEHAWLNQRKEESN
ncbi:Clavaminate synthase-like protein [Xylona heveae TC161]|uniref:Clavaminate synthase-like protein n=1 Tax=Xylona heveae (strain CBS 132557 / TC161) TaxID=1328760 RepID=A0A165JXN6_XYLHT|nr:Clavaminate synthase-like protein [Xylona heveae TC161]KZF26755.1 Clavaminate synthase-like protein [Xylona heveae TC161]